MANMEMATFLIRFLTVLTFVGLSSSKLEVQNRLHDKRKEGWPQSQSVGSRSEEGVWGSWGAWAPCSRTCGAGAAVQTRQCLPKDSNESRSRGGRRRRKLNSANEVIEGPQELQPIASAKSPPGHRTHTIVKSNGTSWRCAGQDKRYHECNTLACPGPYKDFRAEQCTVYNKRPFRGKYFVWQPYVDEKNPCLLNCRPIGRAFYATLAQAIDGTICDKPGFRAICVQGQCKAVGLDGVVSAWGPNPPGQSACGSRLVSGLFTRPQMPLGYTLLTTIPQGACRINVTEMHHSNNYLALKITNGTFVINGNFAISWSGEYEAAGTKFFYRRQSGTMVEALSAPGPLTHSVDVMILYQHPNPGIKYEYTIQIPADEEAPGDPVARPVIAPVLLHVNSSSPRHHGPPNRQQHRPRPDQDDNSISAPVQNQNPPKDADEVVDNGIDQRSRPDQEKYPFGPGVLATESEKPHQPHGSPRHRRRRFMWQIIKYTPCTKPCAGVQSPLYSCVRDAGQLAVPERRCGPRPAGAPRSCGGPCAPRWAPTTWGPCSGPCGTQTRVVHCRQDVAHSALNVKVSDLLCLDKQLSLVQKCQQSECPSDPETAVNTNEINPSNRQYDPTNRNYDSANRQYDPSIRQPESVNNRQYDPSSRHPESGRSQYDASNKQPESGSRQFEPSIRQSNPDVNQVRGQEPILRVGSRSRNFRDKDDVDRFTDGSGTSIITRVSNETRLRPSDVGDRTDDLSNEIGGVNGFRNGGHWKAGNAWIYSEWTQECSEECGRGAQTRMVRCADPSGCDEKKKPVDSRACSSDRKCSTQSFKWFTGPWSPCSDPCAINGKMSREVVCLVYNRGQHRIGSGCPARERPDPERPCPPNLLRADCQPQWFVSDWSQCTGSCGSTQQGRLVTCQGSAGAPGATCLGLRPATNRDCVPSHCHQAGGFTPAPKSERERDNENSLDDTPSSGECIDKITSCHLAVQARLCPYKYYATSCCAACRRALSLS